MPFFIRTIMGSLSYYDVTGDTTRFTEKEFFEKKVEMSHRTVCFMEKKWCS